MKVLIFLSFFLIQTILFSDNINLFLHLSKFKKFEELKVYRKIVDNSEDFVELTYRFITIDYANNRVDVKSKAWDILNTKGRILLLTTLLVNMYDNNGDSCIIVYVDRVIVLNIVNDKILIKKL